MLKPRNHANYDSNLLSSNECYIPLESRQLLAISVGLNGSTGVLTITGSSTADSAYVVNAAGGQVEVTGTGISAQYFNLSAVNRIDFLGYGGNDHFENQTTIVVHAFGHAGDDYLSGGSGADTLTGGPGSDEIYGNQGNDTLRGSENNDHLYGGEGSDTLTGFTGNDFLYGGLGDDFLYGQAGDDTVYGDEGNDRVRGNNGADTLYGGDHNDYMMGDTENDLMFGGAGADELYAWTGDDTLEGGDGDDNLYAHNGNDICRGGSGADLIRGGIGDDSIYGEADDDRLYGENGNDVIRGGGGVDLLRGGNDSDSLHGGEFGTGDTLYGDAGFDRFLRQGSDTIADQAAEDAIIRFENATSNWSDREIEVIDEGLAMLVAQTGNNALLRDSLDPQDLGFFKYAELEGAAAWNQLAIYEEQEWNYITGQWETTGYTYEREIHFADWDELSSWYNSQYSLVAVHELAHNWDSEQELETISPGAGQLWNSFIAVSDWREVNPNQPGNFLQSLDGNHWYASSSSFAEEYGQTNPREDFATIWEYFFNPNADAGLASSLQPKTNVLNSLFSMLQG
ncbi:MAG: Bifunctional hemolysin/adenylate cyclase precursor [Planctomycetota bacterium]